MIDRDDDEEEEPTPRPRQASRNSKRKRKGKNVASVAEPDAEESTQNNVANDDTVTATASVTTDAGNF